MDFTVKVTKWVENQEKIWETIGESQLIIYSWYRMNLKVQSTRQGTTAVMSISYLPPRTFLLKLISFLFADLYCIWCLNQMFNDAARYLDRQVRSVAPR